MRYFITGTPGSGKTTIGKALQEKGHEYVDSDKYPGLADWHDDKTGNIVSPHPNADAEWYRSHSWNWKRDKLESLLDSYGEKDIFICGMTSNQTEDLDLFDKVFLLTANKEKLRTRMLGRREGADAEVIETVFEWHESFETEMIKHGAIVVDSNQESENVVEEILSLK